MWSIFRSQKEKERLEVQKIKDDTIESIKANAIERAKLANEAVESLNNLISKHGVAGVIYFSTRKGKK